MFLRHRDGAVPRARRPGRMLKRREVTAMQRELAETRKLQHYIEVIQRANVIAMTTELDELLDHMLALIIEVTEAQAGTLYLYDDNTDELEFKVVQGDDESRRLVGLRFPASRGVAGYALRAGKPLFIPDVTKDPHWDRQIGELSGLSLRTMYCLPLQLHRQLVGVVQVFNLSHDTVDETDTLSLLQLLGNRLVTEVEKARLLAEAQRRERRQSALVDIISRITSTLNRDELLDYIMNHASQLLEVEATSIWVQDERTGDLVLHIATGERRELMREMRVPAGHGIIGHVVRTGKRVQVDDVRSDSRFYRIIDETSGFVTRSMLCVPLCAPAIKLGDERGELEEVILGGAQAINKRDGRPFDAEDIGLFEALAGQAATVLRLSQLYDETSKMFWGMLDAVTGALDLRDAYTAGHSQRVAEFSVAIGRQLGLSEEEIYHIRISGILHDVGKIGVPDAILNKPDRLTDEEWEAMRSHPTKGADMMKKNKDLAWLLREELPGLMEHHERLDGSGYPNGLLGSEISQIGRILAVADAFDAMTSNRRYRPGMSVEVAFQRLRDAIGTEFDPICVDALVAAYAHGEILVQREREQLS